MKQRCKVSVGIVGENSLQVFLLSEAEKKRVQPARLCSRHKHPMSLFSLVGITLWHHKYSLNFSKSTKTNHIALRSPDHHYPARRHCKHAAWYSSSITSRGAPLVQQYKNRESPKKSKSGGVGWSESVIGLSLPRTGFAPNFWPQAKRNWFLNYVT